MKHTCIHVQLSMYYCFAHNPWWLYTPFTFQNYWFSSMQRDWLVDHAKKCHHPQLAEFFTSYYTYGGTSVSVSLLAQKNPCVFFFFVWGVEGA